MIALDLSQLGGKFFHLISDKQKQNHEEIKRHAPFVDYYLHIFHISNEVYEHFPELLPQRLIVYYYYSIFRYSACCCFLNFDHFGEKKIEYQKEIAETSDQLGEMINEIFVKIPTLIKQYKRRKYFISYFCEGSFIYNNLTISKANIENQIFDLVWNYATLAQKFCIRLSEIGMEYKKMRRPILRTDAFSDRSSLFPQAFQLCQYNFFTSREEWLSSVDNIYVENKGIFGKHNLYPTIYHYGDL